MADFVAVIRRAVDGLAKNTPDMRDKVYEKARGAVRRQLENMKPTPSDDLILRQMDKLEAAIDSVEAEHAEALPADEPLAAPVGVVPDVVDEPEPAPAGEAAPVSPVPVSEETVAAAWPQEPAVATQPDAVEVDDETVADEQPSGDEPADEQQPETHYASHEEEPAEASGASAETWPHAQDAGEEPPHHEEPVALVEHEEPLSADADRSGHAAAWPAADAEADRYAGEVSPAREADQSYSDHSSTADGTPAWKPEEDRAAVSATADDWVWPPEDQPAEGAEDVWQDVGDLSDRDHAASAEFLHPEPVSETVEAHFDEQTHAAVDSVRMPPVTDLPDLSVASTDDPHGQPSAKESDPWSDLEELIGYNKDALPAGEAATVASDGDGDMIPPPPRTYRVAPKKRSFTGLILALIGLLIVAGGGYALWLNRDSLTEIVGDSEPAAPATAPAPDEDPPDCAPAAAGDAPPAESDTAESEPAAPATEDGVAADSKFTQRLLADGTEIDEGPGANGAVGEGQSVAQLNAPPASPADAETAGETSAEPSATPDDAAALSGEKMFLYEERLGQTAPTAIEGAVSWSLVREPGADGVQEPVVQGRLNIPGRGLTALLTFKRNSDASLPASHLVEIVFAVPPGFEGGAIDNVQRIAMKPTEQDRGDALIAVPAKITDDFHMIALNDFPDARATNIELLRSRNWMDIPLAYRNGRRALLTLQKGETGTQAFNEAIREWAALGGGTDPAPTGQ